MIATWMLYGIAVAFLVGFGALALDRGARLLGRAGRWCWVGAIATTLALPAVAWFRPGVLPAVITIPMPNGGTIEATPPVRIEAPAITYRTGPPLTWSDLNRPLAYGWGMLSLGLLAWFGIGTWRLRRMRRSWRAEGDILVSENVGPAVVGFLDCRVVVPQWSLELGADQRDLLLAHEAEHVVAHDSRVLLLAATVLALVPWNLGLWWQFRRLRLAIELDCDARVLKRRPDRAVYGRLLLDVGARAARSLVPVAAFHEPTSSLEKRIRSMTAPRPKRAGLLAALMAVVAGGTAFVACEAPRPTAPAAKKEAFTYQTHEEEGRLISTFIADSVSRYFGAAGTRGPVYLWFIVSPDHHVLRYGTTPRKPSDNVIRSRAADSVVPGFAFPKMQSVNIVGENTIEPGSQPVYWAVLRDPNQPSGYLADTTYLAQVPWVLEAMQKYYPGLLAATSGPPVDVWFVADAGHDVLKAMTVAPHTVRGTTLGPIHNLDDVFPGLGKGTIMSITPGAGHGWARDNVRAVWVALGE